MIKDFYYTLNCIGGLHAVPVMGYIYNSGFRMYGVSGACGHWNITDIATGCKVGKVEKLKDLDTFINAELESKIKNACKSNELLQAMEIIRRAYVEDGRIEERTGKGL